MLELQFTPFPELISSRFRLRKMMHRDAEEILFLRSDAEILKYLIIPPAKNIEEVNAFIDKITKGIDENKWIFWAIVEKDNDKVIGTISVWNLREEDIRAELGYVLHPSFHRQGVMKEVLPLALNYALKVMKVHSFEAHVNPMNVASRKLLEHLGFEQEGYFKENVFFEGEYQDTVVYGYLNKSEI